MSGSLWDCWDNPSALSSASTVSRHMVASQFLRMAARGRRQVNFRVITASSIVWSVLWHVLSSNQKFIHGSQDFVILFTVWDNSHLSLSWRMTELFAFSFKFPNPKCVRLVPGILGDTAHTGSCTIRVRASNLPFQVWLPHCTEAHIAPAAPPTRYPRKAETSCELSLHLKIHMLLLSISQNEIHEWISYVNG